MSFTPSDLSDRARRRAAWIVPAVVAVGAAAGITLTGGSASGAAPDLPRRSAAQLLTAVQQSDATALVGVVSETADLGIPALPGDTSSASLSWQTFISGTHSARVWIDGPARQRVALLGELSEADVVHNGKNLWTYTSETNTVTHTVLNPPDRSGTRDTSGTAPDARDSTPAAVTAKLLKAIDPSTAVSIDTSRMVAGRPAYTLVLTPKDTRSTVSKVTIAIDAAKSVPLQVQVFGSGSSPAFQTGFSSVSFRTPAASRFAFRTPAGATVSNNPFTDNGHRHGDRGGQGWQASSPLTPPSATSGSTPAGPKVIGKGWTSVVEIPSGGAANLAGSLPHDATTPIGSSGAQLFHTALVNVIFLPDGRTFVGAVQPALLEHIAGTTR